MAVESFRRRLAYFVWRITNGIYEAASECLSGLRPMAIQVAQPKIERVGLPSYNFGRECERGDTSGKLGTAYPTGLALGGTFDVELVHAIAVWRAGRLLTF